MDTESVARLRRVISRMARQLNASSTEGGLTPSQASVLGVVATRGPMGLAELAEVEGLNPTMLSRVIGRLEELGLMTRRSDPADLRAVQVEASPEGVAVHNRIRLLRTQALAECLERLPPATVESLGGALPALEELADQLRPHAGRTPH
jgi:DNA-binding MarR family transcriptional regulator